MRIKKGFVLREMCGENIVSAEGLEHINFNKLISLNSTAAFLWKALEGKEFTEEEMADYAEHKEYFDLSMMTDKFKSEWQANAHWLKLSFHAKSEFPSEPYKRAEGSLIKAHAKQILAEIVRFAGPEVLSACTTVHFGEATEECVTVLREMGYKAVIVEGNPMNYRSRGFVTSAPYGITAHSSVGLPAPECLMVQELVPGGLTGIQGQVCYADYDCLR